VGAQAGKPLAEKPMQAAGKAREARKPQAEGIMAVSRGAEQARAVQPQAEPLAMSPQPGRARKKGRGRRGQDAGAAQQGGESPDKKKKQ